MKVHTNLKELLEDFIDEYHHVLGNELMMPNDFITYYASSNSLALGKQKPLAKNKANGNFFCKEDFKYERCSIGQCLTCYRIKPYDGEETQVANCT